MEQDSCNLNRLRKMSGEFLNWNVLYTTLEYPGKKKRVTNSTIEKISFQSRGVELFIGEQIKFEIETNKNLWYSLTTNSVVMNKKPCDKKTFTTMDCKLTKIIYELPIFLGENNFYDRIDFVEFEYQMMSPYDEDL